MRWAASSFSGPDRVVNMGFRDDEVLAPQAYAGSGGLLGRWSATAGQVGQTALRDINVPSRNACAGGTQLVCIDPEHVRSIWPLAAPLLRRAIVKTGLSAFATIEREILDGNSLLWVAWNGCGLEAAASTSLQQTEAGKVCVITACAGAGMMRWRRLVREIEAYAQAEGCHCVRIFGRKGWTRVLEGYEQTYAIVDKRLP